MAADVSESTGTGLSDWGELSGMEESRFYIPATASLQERRPRILKDGDTFALFDHYGDIPSTDSTSPEGLFHRDTRYLSRFELRMNGGWPLLLSSTALDNNAALMVDLTNPDLYDQRGLRLPRDTVHIHRAIFVHQAAIYERIALSNFGRRAERVSVLLSFAADFADLFEVRGQRRPRRGKRSARIVSSDRVEIRYRGLDEITRSVTLCFDPSPGSLKSGEAAYELELPPGERRTIFVRVSCDHSDGCTGWSGLQFQRSMRASRRKLRQASGRATAIEGSDDLFNEMIRRSVCDLYTLMTDTEHGPYPYAGIPWFSTAFGRDALITALMMLWLDPSVARGVLQYLAANQATRHDPFQDAEPGKILHEVRNGEMARLREVPFERYYGSIDSTPLFLVLAGEYFERTGDLETIRRLWPNIQAAVDWIDSSGDIDGDGFVEYSRQKETGLANQGWKDSHDSIFHADGRNAEGAIALCEVQSYVFAARRHVAGIARALGLASLAAIQEERAQRLREQFEREFWCDDLGVYAMALDGRKEPCRVVSSNAGQALLGGIAAPERAARVAATLFAPDSFSGWGIRTIPKGSVLYNPMSYHNGSVWPHDNALIALGLANYGLRDYSPRLLKGLFEAAAYLDLRRLPELFCGFPRKTGKGPTSYPVACAPQAWASAAPLALLKATLGLTLDHAAGEIRFDHPVLPDFLEKLHLRRLKLGEASADVMLHRYGTEVALSVLRREGDLKIVVAH